MFVHVTTKAKSGTRSALEGLNETPSGLALALKENPGHAQLHYLLLFLRTCTMQMVKQDEVTHRHVM